MKRLIFLAAAFFSILICYQLMVIIDDRDSENERGPDSYPAEYFWLQRTFPFGKADNDVYRKALQQRKQMPGILKKNSALSWKFAGPENIGGRMVDVEFDPSDGNTVYAAAATGGVFVSYDKGLNWHAVFDDQAVLTIGDIAIDPVNTQTLYVGTGEANGGHNNFPGGGVYKSTDGGETWEFMGLGNTASIGRIVVDPLNPQRVFVAAVGSYFAPNPERGVYVSEDGGASWTQSLFVSDSTGAIDLVMDQANPDYMLAAMWERVRRPVERSGTHLYGNSSGIYRTTDGGKSWQELGPSTGLPDAELERVGRIGLAMYPGDTKILYALYNDGSEITGLYRSNDGGDSWTKTDANPTGNTFSWYFGQVRVHPTNPDMVYALDIAFSRSENGGNSWPLDYGYSPSYEGLHVDHHALAFHPDDPDYLIDGNDGGLNISTDGGLNWIKVSRLPVTQFYEIGLDKTNPWRYYGGTQDNGTLRTAGGLTDDWEKVLGGDGFYVLVSPDDPGIIYCEWQWGNLYRYEESNGSYYDIVTDEMENDPHNWSTPVAMDPQNSQILYYGTNRLWRSEDRGNNWAAVSGNLTRDLPDSRVGTITTISISPQNSELLYVGTDDGLVWVTMDYGLNWQNISDSLPFRWVTRVLADPVDEAAVYVTFSGLRWKDPQPHIFKSADFGQNWQDISSNLPDAPLNAIAVDSLNNDIIYVGSDVGAFYSADGGFSWDILGESLPAVVINDMKIHPLTHELVAGTHGRSIYTLDLDRIVAIKDMKGRAAGGYRLQQNYPNPFNPLTNIGFQTGDLGFVSIFVYNTLGQKVATLVNKQMNAGNYTVQWDATGFAGGVYFYRLVSDKGIVSTKKMILIR